jgi:hypothetical protein
LARDVAVFAGALREGRAARVVREIVNEFILCAAWRHHLAAAAAASAKNAFG